MSALLPREIKPELIEIGDTIQVKFRRDGGLTVTHEGRVYESVTHGKTRYLRTAEGTTILAWEPGAPKRQTIILIKREPVEGQTLFEFSDFTEIHVRLSA